MRNQGFFKDYFLSDKLQKIVDRFIEKYMFKGRVTRSCHSTSYQLNFIFLYLVTIPISENHLTKVSI